MRLGAVVAGASSGTTVPSVSTKAGAREEKIVDVRDRGTADPRCDFLFAICTVSFLIDRAHKKGVVSTIDNKTYPAFLRTPLYIFQPSRFVWDEADEKGGKRKEVTELLIPPAHGKEHERVDWLRLTTAAVDMTEQGRAECTSV